MTSSIRKQSAESHISNIYSSALELYGTKYSEKLGSLRENKDELSEVIHSLVDEIVVYTRYAKSEDKIADKKKSNQQVPFRIEIKLRPPQDFLADLVVEQEKLYKEQMEIDAESQRKWHAGHDKLKGELLVKKQSW